MKPKAVMKGGSYSWAKLRVCLNFRMESRYREKEDDNVHRASGTDTFYQGIRLEVLDFIIFITVEINFMN